MPSHLVHRTDRTSKVFHSPTREKKCQLNSATRSTSVVINVIICALLEKSSSGVSFFFSSAGTEASLGVGGEVPGSEDGVEPDDEATSFLTSVFAKRMVLSCTLRRTCRVVVEIDLNVT
jgi:hypothetical protein